MARGRRSESFEEARGDLLRALAAGRIRGKEVMEELEIGAGTLGGWVRAEQLRVRARGPGAPSTFVPVRVAPALGGFVVEVGEGLCVRVEPGLDAREVALVVRALRDAC